MSWGDINEELKKEEIEKMEIKFENLKDVQQKRGLKILSYGNFSTGKTHFGLSSTKPVYIIDTESGAPPLADKFPDAKILSICESKGENVDEKDEVLNFEKFQGAVEYLIQLPDKEIGTIVVDNISDIWSWCQAYAKTKVFKIPIEDRFKQQFDWGIPNNLMRKTISKLINKNCDLILIAREGEIYEGAGKPSGRYKADVQKKIPFYVDVILYHEVKIIKVGQITFTSKIEKCRQNGSVLGMIIENPDINKIKQLINKK